MRLTIQKKTVISLESGQIIRSINEINQHEQLLNFSGEKERINLLSRSINIH